MPLLIEALDEPGPCGLPALSVSHYGEQNGDLMRDPEMCFELSFAGGIADLNPFYYRQDYVGCEQWSRFITGTDYSYSSDLHRQHVSFAKVWNRNLQMQGFVEGVRASATTGSMSMQAATQPLLSFPRQGPGPEPAPLPLWQYISR